MIEGAPADLDIRAAINLEQVAELIQRQQWEEVLPVVLLLDKDHEVIQMHVLEDGQRDPLIWVRNYARTYGVYVDLADSLIVAYKVLRTIDDPSITGEPIIDENGVTPGGCVGHRHEEAYVIAWVSKDRPTTLLYLERFTKEPTWESGEVLVETEEGVVSAQHSFVAAFEALLEGEA